MDAGSGAEHAVPEEMIRAVSSNLNVPLIVGGGIRSEEGIRSADRGGADLLVIGSAFETDGSFFEELEKKGALPPN
jgi:putative glycerol-1-phosphate prenyltransferase